MVVYELPPRLSILLAFVAFQITAFSGVLLNLKIEEILKRTVYVVILAGILGYMAGLLLENWRQRGDIFLFREREKAGEEQEEGAEEENGEEGSSGENPDEEEFEELSFPRVKPPQE